MNSIATNFYRRLPTPARSLAASARGLQLRLNRYNDQLETRVRAALERETWTASDWEDATSQAIEEILISARATPYYGKVLTGRASNDLSAVAVTEKAAVRDNPEAFRSSLAGHRRLLSESTSGTSGTPLHLQFTREAVREWFALNEARVRRWNGLSISDRWAMFGGQVVVPVEKKEPPFWVNNWPMHQLYVSTHHLSRQNAPAIAGALCRFRPRYILGYPSSVALLARFALEDDLVLPRVTVVLSNAEMLSETQRAVISAAFRAPVRNTYGMAEAVAGASECEHGTMHLWPEVGIVEVVDDVGDVLGEPGAAGRMVLTGLLNHAMPLLRYDVGDIGEVPSPTDCRCGRTLPAMGAIRGRSTDFIVTPDGRHVFWINPIFRGLPVAEAQVVQYSLSDVEVRVVSSARWDQANTAQLSKRLLERLGPAVSVRVTLVDEIERDPSGKFRAVISQVPQ